MKKGIKFKTLILFLTILMCIPLTVMSHSGRTDANGGHRDNKNKSGLGSYHYHHGYSAHLHPNGVCPYGGTTKKSIGSSSKSGSSSYKSSGSSSKKSGSSSSSYKSSSGKSSAGSSSASSVTAPPPTSTPTSTPESTPTSTPKEIKPVASTNVLDNYDSAEIFAFCSLLGILLLLCILIYLLCHSEIKKGKNLNTKPFSPFGCFSRSAPLTNSDFYKLYKRTKNLIFNVRRSDNAVTKSKTALYKSLTRFLPLYNKWSSRLEFDSDNNIYSEFLPNNGAVYTTLKGKTVHFRCGCSGADNLHNITYAHEKHLRFCEKCCSRFNTSEIIELIDYRQDTLRYYSMFIFNLKMCYDSAYYDNISKIIQNMKDLRDLIMKEDNFALITQYADDYNAMYKMLKAEHIQQFDENTEPFPNDDELEILKKRFDEQTERQNEQIEQQNMIVEQQNKQIDDIKAQYENIYKEKNDTIRILGTILVMLVVTAAVIFLCNILS